MIAPATAALAALAASFWLLRRDGAWDTYRHPVFLPFLAIAIIMIVLSTTGTAGERRDWRALVARVAAAGAVVAALAALIASRNPIYDLHGRDVVVLAVLEALLVMGAGAATDAGERWRPGTWIRSAFCAAALMLMLAIIPRLLLLVH